jgi:hypothetical protein
MKLNKKLLAVALVAAVVGGSATLAAGTALGHHTTGRFEPGYRMSKQYVALTTYKILRDQAPDAIQGCASDVKQERNRFNDLRRAGAFTRGAINCLNKLGYLQDLPGGTPSDFGKWSWAGQPDDEVYELQAYKNDPLVKATMSLACLTSGDRDSDDPYVWISLDGVALSPDNFEQIGVKYRFVDGTDTKRSNSQGKDIKQRWDAFSDDSRSTTRLVPANQGSFVRQLRSAGTGDLRIVGSDATETIRAFFEVDGVPSVLDILTTC